MQVNLNFNEIFNNHNEKTYLDRNRSFLSFKIYDSSIVNVPKLTICIPTFNRPERILNLLELFNSYNLEINDFLFLICDNNPLNILKKNAIISSLVIYNLQIKYYINERSIGMYENWNRAIYLSNSHWVTLLHDDDLLNINFFLLFKDLIRRFSKYNFIANSFQIIKKTDLDITALYKVNKSRIEYKYLKPLDNFIIGSNVYGAPTCGVIINKIFFESNGGFIVSNNIYPSNDHFSFYFFNLKTTIIKLQNSFGFYVIDNNMSLDKSISIKSAKLNFQFREFFTSVYIKNKILSKLFLEGSNNNLLHMTKNGPFCYSFNDIEEFKEFDIILPNKVNIFIYKLFVKIYKLIKLLHLY